MFLSFRVVFHNSPPSLERALGYYLPLHDRAVIPSLLKVSSMASMFALVLNTRSEHRRRVAPVTNSR